MLLEKPSQARSIPVWLLERRHKAHPEPLLTSALHSQELSSRFSLPETLLEVFSSFFPIRYSRIAWLLVFFSLTCQLNPTSLQTNTEK